VIDHVLGGRDPCTLQRRQGMGTMPTTQADTINADLLAFLQT